MKFGCCLLLFFVCAFAAHAQSPDEQYVRIYQLIQDADRLSDSGQKPSAAAKYLEAQDSLRRFQNIYPGWNERVVNYRLNYIATKLAPLAAAVTPPAPRTNTVVKPDESAASMILTNVPPAPVVVTPSSTPNPMPTPTPAAVPSPTPAPSPELQQQVAALQAEVERLKAENARLGAKLKEALSVQPAAVDPRELAKAEQRIRSLEKENDLLKVRLQMAAATPGDSIPDLRQKLNEQANTIAALRAENEVLKRQRDATASPPAGSEAAAQQAQLLSTLRARITVLEAKPLPYTAEELALLSRPAPAVDNFVTATQSPTENTARKPSKQIPPGAGPLVAAAERAFAAHDYAEAERKYIDVLRQDDNNVSTLANLASTQLELGRYDEAEKNIGKALSSDPDDYFSLYVLGRLRFRQDRLDDAIDALSRSARSNPEYAEAQNYLGIALSEKGLRVPAEAALRRAVQIQPNHAAAHNNLAVVYATQTPPAIALARWHYQRALNAGHPRNADLEKLLDDRR